MADTATIVSLVLLAINCWIAGFIFGVCVAGKDSNKKGAADA